MECIVIQDIFHNETAQVRARASCRLVVPREGRHFHQCRAAHLARAQGHRAAGGTRGLEVTMALSSALGYPMSYAHPSQIMDEIARSRRRFTGVSYREVWTARVHPVAVQRARAQGTPTMHVGHSCAARASSTSRLTCPTHERTSSAIRCCSLPARAHAVQRRRADAPHGKSAWHSEDRLELHPHDAEARGIEHGDWVGVTSRAGDTVLRVEITERVAPGVVYTTFPLSGIGREFDHHREFGLGDQLPEYKVTAVQVVEGGAAVRMAIAPHRATAQARRWELTDGRRTPRRHG
jgi:formate dehydrogenase major subunit